MLIANPNLRLRSQLPPTQNFAAWLIDLDGTLYWQLPVRLAMACELALFGSGDLHLVARFRREQEALRRSGPTPGCPYQTQLERTARALGREATTIAGTISRWMEERP